MPNPRPDRSVAPPGWHTVTPRIVARGARQLVEFLVRAFDATGEYEEDSPSIVRLGDSPVMVSEAGVRPPTPAFLYVYVADADAAYRRAIGAGVRVLEEPLDTPYGDRRCMVEDPWGNVWQVATHGIGTSTPVTTPFANVRLPATPTAVAPDGSDVRVLLGLSAGGMAHFELAAGQVSRAVTHRTVEEIWFIVSGRGEMWRKQGEQENTIVLEPGVCLTLPLGTHFQFRASAEQALAAVGITMPPWPGEDEAVAVAGPWPPSGGEQG